MRALSLQINLKLLCNMNELGAYFVVKLSNPNVETKVYFHNTIIHHQFDEHASMSAYISEMLSSSNEIPTTSACYFTSTFVLK